MLVEEWPYILTWALSRAEVRVRTRMGVETCDAVVVVVLSSPGVLVEGRPDVESGVVKGVHSAAEA